MRHNAAYRCRTVSVSMLFHSVTFFGSKTLGNRGQITIVAYISGNCDLTPILRNSGEVRDQLLLALFQHPAQPVVVRADSLEHVAYGKAEPVEGIGQRFNASGQALQKDLALGFLKAPQLLL